MSFFTKAATAALTGLAIFGFASAAFAHHIEHQPFVLEESRLLVEAVIATGHTVYGGGDICTKHGNGIMGVATSNRQLVVCVANHKGDEEEVADTLRHEALHLAQYCKGRSKGATSALLQPNEQALIQHEAATHLHFTGNGYQPQKIAGEAEARVLAHHLDEWQIAQILIKECGISG